MNKILSILRGVYYYIYYECYKITESWYSDKDMKASYGTYTMLLFALLLFLLPIIYLYRKAEDVLPFLQEYDFLGSKLTFLVIGGIIYFVNHNTVEKEVEKKKKKFYSKEYIIRFLKRITLTIIIISILINVLILYSMYQN